MGLVDEVEINTDHQEPRQALVLLLDTSASMSQSRDIDQLNAGLRSLESNLREPPASRRVEVAIVTFGGVVSTVQDFIEVARFEPPTLEASGATPMGEAITVGLEMAEQRKAVYKSHGLDYFRPWVFMITDGGPTDDWSAAARAVQAAEESRRSAFYAVGTDNADFQTLGKIAVRKPLQLRDNNWSGLFAWLSKSLKKVSGSKPGEQTKLDKPDEEGGWATAPT